MKITVKNAPFRGRAFCYIPAAVTYEGELLPNPDWVASDCITLSTRDPFLPFRVIRKASIVGEGHVPDPWATGPRSRAFTIRGSKGDNYTVTREPTYWTCTCVGYSFRRSCRHINEAKSRLSATAAIA